MYVTTYLISGSRSARPGFIEFCNRVADLAGQPFRFSATEGEPLPVPPSGHARHFVGLPGVVPSKKDNDREAFYLAGRCSTAASFDDESARILASYCLQTINDMPADTRQLLAGLREAGCLEKGGRHEPA